MTTLGSVRGPSPHLSWRELGCKDGTPYPAQWRKTRARELARLFEHIRAIWSKPITIGSAYRTPEHNRRIGGARKSQHVRGRALDLYPPRGVSVREFAQRVRLLANELYDAGEDLVGGIGYYPWGVHVDTRPGNRLVVFHGARLYPDLPGERPR